MTQRTRSPLGILAAGTALGGVLVRAELRCRRLARRLAEAEDLVREHAALRELSDAIARGDELAEVAELVAESAAGLLNAEVGVVLRFDPDGRGVVLGRSARAIRTYPAPGEVLAFRAEGAIGQVRATGAPARARDGTPSPFQTRLGERVAAPIMIEGHLWGAVATGSAPGRGLARGCERRLESFAGLVGLAISSAEGRARLVEMASTDPLTGLTNRRVFEERLAAEILRASRYDRALTVALFDIDHFKQINDRFGHVTGDDALVAVGRAIDASSRTDSVAARLGGDEFAVLLPECSASEAGGAVARICAAIRAQTGDYRLTVSVGVADLASTAPDLSILECADRALYRAKSNGRDTSVVYRAAIAP